ncbi:4-hydroxy-2-oxovalerate aldolase [Oceanospirillum sediminis]|uniref:4-hydroxy-2-oxovalerate aldolase n=1 Tax=Oceanospirillum sediminis TaxID=2760088 RepID=A0A839IM89_9GAMM|nr:4-hydroxy-2-oxovalerate aldolase [Oceanospirillum sediminis]MBB1485632.1 4-hydroxy-2-oxovalerate aldolase [Oceanospirillum sediminis]
MDINILLNKGPQILDCTLRDGSYEVDFQITAECTASMCKKIEKSGIKFIEVGHGVGLRASQKGYGVAAASDTDYMLSAGASVSGNAYWGMFCIPGISLLDDIRKASDHGISFLRIGTNVADYRSAEKFIELAKSLGIFVCSNFMKSYASTPSDFAEVSCNAYDSGSDLIYIVDSAGGMLPSEIEDYAHHIREKNKNIKLGFHGHNNLGLAIANSLCAYELGFSLIDTSIGGLGRSAGNAPTEQFVSTLIRAGYHPGIDPVEILDIYEENVKPLSGLNLDPINVVSGLSLFHSSYLPVIKRYSTKYRVDPRRLIIELCELNKVDAPEALVETLAKKLSENDKRGYWKSIYKSPTVDEQSKIDRDL